MSHYRNIHATAALESLGHRVVNDFKTAYTSSDKLFCSLALARAGIPTPRTFLAFTEESAKKSLEVARLSRRPETRGGKLGTALRPPQGRGLRDRHHRGQGVHVPDVPGLLPTGVRQAPASGHQVVRRGRPHRCRHLPALILRLADQHGQGRQGDPMPRDGRAERTLPQVREGRRRRDRRRRPHGVRTKVCSCTR